MSGKGKAGAKARPPTRTQPQREKKKPLINYLHLLSRYGPDTEVAAPDGGKGKRPAPAPAPAPALVLVPSP